MLQLLKADLTLLVVSLLLFFFFYFQTCSQLPWCRQMQACYARASSYLDEKVAVCCTGLS